MNEEHNSQRCAPPSTNSFVATVRYSPEEKNGEKCAKEVNKQNGERARAKQSLQKILGHSTVEFLLEDVLVATFSFKIDWFFWNH